MKTNADVMFTVTLVDSNRVRTGYSPIYWADI